MTLLDHQYTRLDMYILGHDSILYKKQFLNMDHHRHKDLCITYSCMMYDLGNHYYCHSQQLLGPQLKVVLIKFNHNLLSLKIYYNFLTWITCSIRIPCVILKTHARCFMELSITFSKSPTFLLDACMFTISKRTDFMIRTVIINLALRKSLN